MRGFAAFKPHESRLPIEPVARSCPEGARVEQPESNADLLTTVTRIKTVSNHFTWITICDIL